jgi:hypothetical protein
MLWLAGILFIYFCLLIPSVLLHLFVVYARLARQMIPFLVLLSAQGLVQLEHRPRIGGKLVALVLLLISIQGAWNFSRAYALTYPREFVALAQIKYPEFEFSSKRLAFGAPVICLNHEYIMQNAKYYVDPPQEIPQVQGELLLSASHPVNFLPHQYDGFTPAARRIFRAQNLRMNFYRVDEEVPSRDDPLGSKIKNCMINEK